MFKPDKKTRNYIISLPPDKIPNASRENGICENELSICCGGKNRNQVNRISILVL